MVPISNNLISQFSLSHIIHPIKCAQSSVGLCLDVAILLIVDVCARSRHQGQGQIISHTVSMWCNYLFLASLGIKVCIKGRDKWLHPTDTVVRNYLSLPLTLASDTTLWILSRFMWPIDPFLQGPLSESSYMYRLIISGIIFVCASSQWETTLQCNVVPHWLAACTKLSLHMIASIPVKQNGSGLFF